MSYMDNDTENTEVPKVDETGRPYADYSPNERRRYSAHAFMDDPDIKGIELAALFCIDPIQISKDKKTDAFQEAYAGYGGERLRRAKEKSWKLLERLVDDALDEMENGRYDHVVDYDLSENVIKKQLALQTVMVKAGSDTIDRGTKAAMHISDQSKMIQAVDPGDENKFQTLADRLSGE